MRHNVIVGYLRKDVCQPTLTIPAATVQRTAWNAIDEYFLFNTDSILLELFTTLSLSHNISVSPLIGIPNMRNLNLNAVIYSTYVFMTINSLENVLDSTVFCFLLNYMMGALLTKRIYSVIDLLVLLSTACDVSTKALVLTNLPLGFGILLGVSSTASL